MFSICKQCRIEFVLVADADAVTIARINDRMCNNLVSLIFDISLNCCTHLGGNLSSVQEASLAKFEAPIEDLSSVTLSSDVSLTVFFC